jgi:tetratricopeptide (TPR) repeat protein
MHNPALAENDSLEQAPMVWVADDLPQTPASPVRPDPSAGASLLQTPFERAAMLCQLQRFTDATGAVSAAITEEPRNADAWCLMAEAQLGNERPAAALQAAHAAASLAPERERPRRLASVCLNRLGRDEEAVEAALEATRCEPEAWAAHAQHALSLSALRGRQADARRAAARALELAPQEPGAHLAIGGVALAAGRRAAAASAFCAAIAVDPQCLEAHQQLAAVEALGSRRGLASMWGRMTVRIPRRRRPEDG